MVSDITKVTVEVSVQDDWEAFVAGMHAGVKFIEENTDDDVSADLPDLDVEMVMEMYEKEMDQKLVEIK